MKHVLIFSFLLGIIASRSTAGVVNHEYHESTWGYSVQLLYPAGHHQGGIHTELELDLHIQKFQPEKGTLIKATGWFFAHGWHRFMHQGHDLKTYITQSSANYGGNSVTLFTGQPAELANGEWSHSGKTGPFNIGDAVGYGTIKAQLRIYLGIGDLGSAEYGFPNDAECMIMNTFTGRWVVVYEYVPHEGAPGQVDRLSNDIQSVPEPSAAISAIFGAIVCLQRKR